MKPLSLSARVVDGAIAFDSPARAQAWLAMAEGCRIEVTLDREPKRRSLKQNSRYWSGIVPFVQEVLEQRRGEPVSADIAHYFLKLAFLGHDEFVGPGGEVVIVPKSTRVLDTAAFSAYCERIEAWISQEFHVNPELLAQESA